MSLVPNVRVVPGVSAVVEEDEECVGETEDAVSGEESTVVIAKEREMTTIVLSTS